MAQADDPWPGDLYAVGLPGGNGAALSTDACLRYTDALAAFRTACEHRRAIRVHGLLDRLLRLFGERYARAKRDASGLDFEDLELECRELLRSDSELRERYRARFARIMVDELQDTNQVQLELIELVARGNLFTVGDAQQSIYGFRHADVELFERRGASLAAAGARATLDTNFRSRPEILAVINGLFEAEIGTQPASRFRPLRPGRPPDPDPAHAPHVELLVADKGADWTMEGLGAPWRVAEARALAARLQRLLASGTAARDVVLLTRATTDLRVYERALEDRGIPTYVIGGRGYWSHPQVIDMVGYLEAVANPRSEEALYTVLASPLVGVSADALVVLAAVARARGVDAWRLLRQPGDAFDELGSGERDLLLRFADWFAIERDAAGRTAVESLIDRVIERTGYDLVVLGMPGGQRRLANVRKLMRLAREHEAAHGPDLHDFLDLVARRARFGAAAGEARESEAPVEGEALDAVRLMTIHRAKGLEFEVVCVADLGRGPRWRAELMRIARDGRFGLRLAEPGTGRRESALDFKTLGDERLAAEAYEERRLFYVAMTRARERLILSGAAKLEAWPALEGNGGGGGPIAWIGSALAELDGVSVSFVAPDDLGPPTTEVRILDRRGAAPGGAVEPPEPPQPLEPPPAAGVATAAGAPPEPTATGAFTATAGRAGAPRATGRGAQLLLAGRIPALRLPLLRRARVAAAPAPEPGDRRRRPAGGHAQRDRARDGRACPTRASRLPPTRPHHRGDDRGGRVALRADCCAGWRRRRADHRAGRPLFRRRAVPAPRPRGRRPARGALPLPAGIRSRPARAGRRGVRRDRPRARRPDPGRRLQDRSAGGRGPAGAG